MKRTLSIFIFAVLLCSLFITTIATTTLPCDSTHHPNGVETVYIDGKPVTLPEGDEPSLYKYLDLKDEYFSWSGSVRPYHNDTKKQLVYYRLHLNSLKWLSDADVSPSEWEHEVVLIKPYVALEGKAMLWIDGCNNTDPLSNDCYLKDLSNISQVASSTGSMMFVLFNVPNQPTVFTSDPKQEVRIEDSLISFTWDKFMTEAQDRPDWIAYFPMTKAALRCMDAGEEFSKLLVQNGLLTKPITQWYPFGMSKRGATTWYLSAYLGARQPNRILGSSPIVFDAINFSQVVLESMPAKLGGFTTAFLPYASSLQLFLDEGKRKALFRHVDLATEWYSRGLSAVKKYVISSGLDEFFLLGNDRYWYDLIDNKHRLLIPHADHAFLLDADWLFKGLAAHSAALLHGVELPLIVDRVDYERGFISMCSDVKPTQSVVYSAQPNPQEVPRVDYRMMRIPDPANCLSPASIQGDYCVSIADWKIKELKTTFIGGMWCAEFTQNNIPTDTWVSSYIVFSYDDKAAKGPGVYSTPVMTLPDVLPFKGCLSDPAHCPSKNFL